MPPKQRFEPVPEASPAIAEHLRMHPMSFGRDRNVLDAGCGSGVDAVRMALGGYTAVLGIDNNPNAIAAAEARWQGTAMAKKATKDSERCRFEQMDMREAARLDSLFSVIVSNETLQTLPKREQFDFLTDLQNLSKPRGIHVIGAYLVNGAVTNPNQRSRLMQPGELQRFYTESGWSIERTFITAKAMRVQGEPQRVPVTNLIARRTR